MDARAYIFAFEYLQNILEGACDIEWLRIGDLGSDFPIDVHNAIIINGGSQIAQVGGQAERLSHSVSCSVIRGPKLLPPS